ncbi:MAG: 2-oxoacid:acceptor oxidoreductase family protein [Candidatus Gastranaerophilales bacterium]|nr:2-oxoacid:acceptor oxidoreductase family protein [Candidatus Gastranaerophilales bacterium]
MEKNYIIAGFGGQGVLFAGKILANAFMLCGKNVTWYPCYGAEMRGGTVNCEIVVSDEEVSSVHKQDADCVIALNQLSFDRFISKIKKAGHIICNSSLIKEEKTRNDINYTFFPMTDAASGIGNYKPANMVALGVLSNIEKILSVDILKKAIDIVLPDDRKKLAGFNIEAILSGYENLLPAC